MNQSLSTQVDVDEGGVNIVDVDTSRGDEGIRYEIVSARSNCGDYWSKKGKWSDWDIYNFSINGGYMYVEQNNVDPNWLPTIKREVSGLSGLSKLEFDIDPMGQSYNWDLNARGTWALLDLYFDDVKYVTWENFKEVKPVAAHVYNVATISPTGMPLRTGAEPFTTFRITVPWDGRDKATLKITFNGLYDDYWISTIMPVGDTALGNCEDTNDAKYLFDIDTKTGELKFKSSPKSDEYYRVKVKATTEVGLEGDATFKVGVH